MLALFPLLLAPYDEPPRVAAARQVAADIPYASRVLVQEYWTEGAPHLILANRRDQPIRLQIVSPERGEGQLLAGPWEVAPHEVADVDARPLHGRALVGVHLADGERLGLLRCSDPPPDLPTGPAFVTFTGLNGRGGVRYDLWFTQSDRAFRPGAEIPITVTIAEGSGRLVFGEAAEDAGQLPVARVVGATSATLPVEPAGPGSFAVETSDLAPGRHALRLRVRLPEVETPTLVALPCRLLGPGRAPLTRGLLVVPAGP